MAERSETTDRPKLFYWPTTILGWVVFFFGGVYLILCVAIFLAALYTLAPPLLDAIGVAPLRGPPAAAPSAYDDFLRYYRPSVLLFAGLVAALSIPLVLYRARIQTRSVVQAEKDGRRDQERLQNDRDEAVRQSQTERRLRAIEMLGATLPKQTIAFPTPPGAENREETGPPTPVVITEQAPNMEVRLGALSVLEELAKEPVPDRKGGAESLANHWPVMETVLAYLRRRRGDPDALWAPFHAAHPMPAGYDGWDDSVHDEARIEAPVEERIAYAKAKAAYARRLKPEDDCAAAIAILRRRSAEQHAHELGIDAPHPEIDWKAFDAANPAPKDDTPQDQRAQLWAARVEGLDTLLGASQDVLGRTGGSWRNAAPLTPKQRYDQIDLAASSLAGSDLSTATLTRLAMPYARIEGADLRGTRMAGTDLRYGRMEGALLQATRLEGANLREARMEGADFSGAQLAGANFSFARLDGAIFHQSRMEGASFFRATMSGVDLSTAKMEMAVLIRARLEGANLRTAWLERSDLSGADLAGATLSGTFFRPPVEQDDGLHHTQGLTQTMINRTFGDAATVLPDDLERPDHWSKEKLDITEADVEWAAWRKAEGFATLPQHKIYER